MRRAILLAVAVATAVSGCIPVVVRTDPPGAMVLVNGAQMGPSPVHFTHMNGAGDHTYSASAPGFVVYSIEASGGREVLIRLRPLGGAPAFITPAPTPSGVTAPPAGLAPAPAGRPIAPVDRGDR